MGAKKKKTKNNNKIHFELSKSAIAGIGMIFLCVVLWIFLLGVWAGQTFMVPTSKERISMEKSIAHIKKNIVEFDEKNRSDVK